MSHLVPFGTLFRYFAARYVGWVGLCLVGLAMIISLIQTVELVRRVSVRSVDSDEISYIKLAFLNLPKCDRNDPANWRASRFDAVFCSMEPHQRVCCGAWVWAVNLGGTQPSVVLGFRHRYVVCHHHQSHRLGHVAGIQ